MCHFKQKKLLPYIALAFIILLFSSPQIQNIPVEIYPLKYIYSYRILDIELRGIVFLILHLKLKFISFG